MEAEIITIGDEILIGQIIDTNSAWLGRQFSLTGIKIRQITSISDDAGEITRAFDEAFQRARIIIVTGGLGPTKDDITKHTLAKYFNSPMREHAPSLENIKNIFSRFKRPFLEVNRMQAQVPEACEALLNTQGTAPGMWFEKNGAVLVSLPGVPHEMKNLMLSEVIPRLQQRFALPHIYHKTILTAGIGESFLADLLEPVEKEMPEQIKLAYLPSLGVLRLRLSSSGVDEGELVKNTEAILVKIRLLAGPYILAEDDISLAEVILKKLELAGKTLALAESCTGGYLAHQLTSIPGSSRVFLGSMVVYSNDLKEQVLTIPQELIDKNGAVSEPVAQAMATNVLEISGADYVISLTGIAGPGGDSPEKPLGLVYIGIASREKVEVHHQVFGRERLTNIERFSNHALLLLYRFLDEGPAIP